MEKELNIKIRVKNDIIFCDIQNSGFVYLEIVGALFDAIAEIQSQHKKSKRKIVKKL